jgi:hypothetical protein
MNFIAATFTAFFFTNYFSWDVTCHILLRGTQQRGFASQVSVLSLCSRPPLYTAVHWNWAPSLPYEKHNRLAHHCTFAVRLDKGVERPSLHQQQRFPPRPMHQSCLPLPQAPLFLPSVTRSLQLQWANETLLWNEHPANHKLQDPWQGCPLTAPGPAHIPLVRPWIHADRQKKRRSTGWGQTNNHVHWEGLELLTLSCCCWWWW